MLGRRMTRLAIARLDHGIRGSNAGRLSVHVTRDECVFYGGMGLEALAFEIEARSCANASQDGATKQVRTRHK